jgi:hypothetical protein
MLRDALKPFKALSHRLEVMTDERAFSLDVRSGGITWFESICLVDVFKRSFPYTLEMTSRLCHLVAAA